MNWDRLEIGLAAILGILSAIVAVARFADGGEWSWPLIAAIWSIRWAAGAAVRGGK